MWTKAAGYVRRHHLGFVAVFLSLGGSAYAASQLPAGSVGTKQIRNQAVTPAKLSNAVRTALASAGGRRGPAGPRGEQGTPGTQGPQGMPGAQGPAGDRGLKGDQGATGPSGISGLTLVSATSTLDSSTYKQLTVSCPSGLTPISGGVNYAAQTAPAPLAVAASQPAVGSRAAFAGETPDGWFGAVNEETAYASSWTVSVFAECAQVS